jgi:hypothetical protein
MGTWEMDKKYAQVETKELEPLDLPELLNKKGYSRDEIAEILKQELVFVSTERDESGSRDIIRPDSIDLGKKLAASREIAVSFAIDKKGHRYKEQLSAEIYIGVMVFLATTNWDLVKGTISNYLYDKFRAMKKENKSLVAKVELQFNNTKSGVNYHLKYTGPADKVADIVAEMEPKE